MDRLYGRERSLACACTVCGRERELAPGGLDHFFDFVRNPVSIKLRECLAQMLLNQQQALDSVQPVASTSAVPYHSQSASVDSDSSSAQSPPRAVIINGQVRVVEKSGGRLKKFICPHEDCGKAYTRPVRLEEHIRSHTGEVHTFPADVPSEPQTLIFVSMIYSVPSNVRLASLPSCVNLT